VKRYVFVSAVSVYGDPTDRPVRETHPRVSPAGEEVTEVVGELYGRLKVTCENIVQEVFGDRSALLRPQIVVGPYDLSRRYTFWAERTLRGGEVLAPGDGSDHLQVIDARDLARFVRTVVETGVGGPFNLAGPRLTWADFMVLLGAQNPVWVPAGILGAASVSEFELPLFRPEHGPRSGLMDISNQRAQAAGLTLTAPETTLREVRAWLHGQHLTPLLSPAREAQLILQARVQPSTGREHGRNAGSGEDSGP
jgi:2'-hydroxyisoflavone reductase